VIAYATNLVQATRKPAGHGLERFAPAILFGGSPRASIYTIIGARALAFVRGRQYVLPQDVVDVVPDVLRHRLVLSYEGIVNGITADTIISAVLERYPPPRIDLGDRNVA
ncbi:MAG: ATPase, partial [Chloroflexi bacterium]|nr:ATPase [Chloroflexota bacterium]